MPQSLARVVVHLVFSTRNRTPWLQEADVRSELYCYMAASLKTLGCSPIKINGVEDHVHLIFGLSRNHPIKKIVGEVKSDSSLWIKTKGGPYQAFFWQAAMEYSQ